MLCLLICHYRAQISLMVSPSASFTCCTAAKFLTLMQQSDSSEDIAIMSEDDDLMVVDSSSALPACQRPEPPANRLLRQTRSEPWQPVPRAILIPDVPPQDFAEIFSPPRVSVACRELGLSADHFFDLDYGCDLRLFECRAEVKEKLFSQNFVKFIMFSPPCTMYSALQKCFRNFEKLSQSDLDMKWEEAHAYVDFCMHLCRMQGQRGLWWCFEHPQTASSWSRQSVKDVSALPNVEKITFHQCRVGLKAPGSDIPIRKATTLMTNAPLVAEAFRPLLCQCSVPHQRIEGSFNGIPLSKFCQKYPMEMCRVLARAVSNTIQP